MLDSLLAYLKHSQKMQQTSQNQKIKRKELCRAFTSFCKSLLALKVISFIFNTITRPGMRILHRSICI